MTCFSLLRCKFATRLLNTEKDAQDFEAFFKNKDTSKLSMTIPQSLDGIRSRAAWLEVSQLITIVE